MQYFSQLVKTSIELQARDSAESPQCSNYITINTKGRLGNQMSQYMTLLFYAKKLDMKPVIGSEMRSKLLPLFPYISTISTDELK